MVNIFAGRQDGPSMGPPFWQKNNMTAIRLDVNHTYKTLRDSLINDTSF